MNDDETSRKLHDLLHGFSTAMLITHAGGGLRARPMAIASLTESCELWFITGSDSAKAHEVEQDTRVHVVCQEDHSAYVALEGRAELSSDRKRIADVWRPAFRVWFPEGMGDPDIVLIHVIPERAEFWDNTGINKLAYVWELARALATGKPPQVKEGQQHAVVTL